MPELKTVGLFLVTALAEIVGCYLPYLWLRGGKTIWLLIPGALSLAAFAWLLSLHPTAAGRVYAAYGGVYIFMAIRSANGLGSGGHGCGFNGHGHHYVCAQGHVTH